MSRRYLILIAAMALGLTQGARAQNLFLLASDMIALGDGASVVRQSSGAVTAKIPHRRAAICRAGSIAIASTRPAHIVTVKAAVVTAKDYPHGLAACFDAKQFNGKATVIFEDQGITIAPATLAEHQE